MNRKAIIISAILSLSVLTACGENSDLSSEVSDTSKSAETSLSNTIISESTTDLSTSSADIITNAPDETTVTTTTPAVTTSAESVAAFLSLPNFLDENSKEYVEYQNENPNLDAQTVVTYVNIGLNRPFYTDIQTIANPDSIMVFCNKYNALPAIYEPFDLMKISDGNSFSGRELYLRANAATAFEKLCSAAKTEGYTIIGQSAYRSYSYQKQLYDNYVASDGQKNADTYSARPGHSEHQTGLAIDVRNAALPYNQFGQTAEYKWAKDNIHKYGFVIHYTAGSEKITGYKTEEWHFRYVGVNAAAEIYNLGITLDEYLATYYV